MSWKKVKWGGNATLKNRNVALAHSQKIIFATIGFSQNIKQAVN